MTCRVARAVALAVGAVLGLGHGAVVPAWDLTPTAYRGQSIERIAGKITSAEIASAADHTRQQLMAGRHLELGRVLDAARLRGSATAVIASAEQSYWRGEVVRDLPSSGGLLDGYLAVLAASSALRSLMPVPLSTWTRIAVEAEQGQSLMLGAAHGARLAQIVAAVNPALGEEMARQQFRAHTRRGDSTGAARALLLLGALETRGGRTARSRALTERAAHRAAASADGATIYAALAQLADVSGREVVLAENVCTLVPAEQERLRGSCLSAQVARLWREGRIRAAMASFRAARTLAGQFGAWWHMDFATRTAPLLLGLSRWDEFDEVVGAGIVAASNANHTEVEAELWLKVSLSARARGYPAMAGRALGKARGLAGTERHRIAIEVSAARLALAEGSTDEALHAYQAALELADDGFQIPFDAHMIAADLAVAPPTGESGTHPDVATAGMSLLAGLGATLGALDEDTPSEQAAAGLGLAAHRISQWADAAGRSDLNGALAAARSVWTRLARALLATERPAEALVAVERLRAGLHDQEQLQALRRDLPRGAGVLVFADLANELWWWAIDAQDVVAGRVPRPSTAVRGFSAVYSGRLRRRSYEGVDVALAGQELSQQVLGPVLRQSGWGDDHRWIAVVPAAGLEDVPIDTLPLPSDPARTMGDRYTITRVTSLRDLQGAMASRAPSNARVAFVPRVGPDAQDETRAVRAVGARVFSGPKATRAAFLEAARGVELLHFGGHALAADLPGGAALSFAGATTMKQEVWVSEIARLELQGATVVLLGCDTGVGGSDELGATGRGRSLAEAFVRAGGRGVVASLWPIDDESAREIAAELYSEPSEVPTAATLARAKAALRRRHPREPYRWAGFVWYGSAKVD